MFSSLFIKLSLVTLGSIGLGTGGYFVYKTFSKKSEVANTTPSLPGQNEGNPSAPSPTLLPSSPVVLDNGGEQSQRGGEGANSPDSEGSNNGS